MKTREWNVSQKSVTTRHDTLSCATNRRKCLSLYVKEQLTYEGVLCLQTKLLTFT